VGGKEKSRNGGGGLGHNGDPDRKSSQGHSVPGFAKQSTVFRKG
jgi:hypothetical protein